MDYVIVTETFYDDHIELILACTTVEEALRVHGVALDLGYKVFPAPKVLALYGSKIVRILINDDKDRLILKLAL